MNNSDFEVKLLLRQNTEMSLKLQNYRRQNQQLNRKNQDLNSWVQNLSDVLASLSAAWKVITNNEETLFNLMRKKTDPNSKALISKYTSHFKAFEDIIDNLAGKITNEGHSETATLDAKTRLASFVNNYNLFFMEFVDTFFKFNEEYIVFMNDKLKQFDAQQFYRQLMAKEIENRQKLKELQPFVAQLKNSLKVYQESYQHKLLDGIVALKSREIEGLKDLNAKQNRRISYMTDYNAQNVSFIIQNDNNLECLCGGAHLQYFSKVWEENLKNKTAISEKCVAENMVDESDGALQEKLKRYEEDQIQKELLLQRNVQISAKCEKLKLQIKLSDEVVLKSPVFLHLRNQFKDLMEYTNDLVARLNKSYDYLNEIERLHLDELDQLKRKHEKTGNSGSVSRPQETAPDFRFLANFKSEVLGQIGELKKQFVVMSTRSREKESSLVHVKEQMVLLKKENDDMNRKINELHERQLKTVENLQFRHGKFSELEIRVNEMFRTQPQSQDIQKSRKTWEQFVDYVKTRDKKIKSMEEMLRKKDKEIAQKAKLEDICKNALNQTETIYTQTKEKLDTFQTFTDKIEKELVALFEENYRFKIEAEQEKNFLNLKLKNETESRSRLEERLKLLERIEDEVKATREKELQIESKFRQFARGEREKCAQTKMQLKEKEREGNEMQKQLAEKDRTIDKLIEDKERKNLEINALRLDSRAIEGKQEYEDIKRELQDYKLKIMCSCSGREKEVALNTCAHLFCKKCIEDTTANRNRKCPLCSVRYTKTDVHDIAWA